MQAETKFKKRVKADLTSLGAACWHVKTQQVAIRGTPDILACLRGVFVALELKKSADEKPDPLQEHNLKLIRSAGGFARRTCPEDWPDVFGELQKIATGC